MIYIFLRKGTFIRPHFQAIGGYTYHAGQSWKADFGSLDGPIKTIAAGDNSGADLGVFMCKDPELSGVIGIAWVGFLCRTSSFPGLNAGVNEKRENVLATSEVRKKIFQVDYCMQTIFNPHFFKELFCLENLP